MEDLEKVARKFKTRFVAATVEETKPAEEEIAPEKIRNVFNSTSAASSTTFHIYRVARRAEMERNERMDEDHEQKLKDEEFKRKQMKNRQKEAQRTMKNAERRKKRKMRKRSGTDAKENKKQKSSGSSEE